MSKKVENKLKDKLVEVASEAKPEVKVEQPKAKAHKGELPAGHTTRAFRQ